MSLNIFKIKKWAKMLLGKSAYHVNQTEGLCYSTDKIEGYYNNLTEKITRFGMPGDEIPITADDDGSEREFSIAIFQYGLAAYDLWLMKGEEQYLRKFKNCVDWAVKNQRSNGAWDAFSPQNPEQPYSSMAQGEGISLLTRAYTHYKDPKYAEAAKKGYEFLITDRKQGGVADYSEGGVEFYEFTYKPLVLNGWIFSIWGIYDYYKMTKDEKAAAIWGKSVETLIKSLPRFDMTYWSHYNTAGALTSPFYQNLHVAQMQAMHKLTGRSEFEKYAKKWQGQLNNPFFKALAFVKKSIQKILE